MTKNDTFIKRIGDVVIFAVSTFYGKSVPLDLKNRLEQIIYASHWNNFWMEVIVCCEACLVVRINDKE